MIKSVSEAASKRTQRLAYSDMVCEDRVRSDCD